MPSRRNIMIGLLLLLFLVGVLFAIKTYTRQTTEGFRYKLSAKNVAKGVFNTAIAVASGGTAVGVLSLDKTEPKEKKSKDKKRR
jgi:hypothetical protein